MVLGLTKIPVPDQKELRRKRIEDTFACGRVVKTITQPAKRQACPTITTNDSSEEIPRKELETGDVQIGYPSPSPVQLIPLSPGMKTRKSHSTVMK